MCVIACRSLTRAICDSNCQAARNFATFSFAASFPRRLGFLTEVKRKAAVYVVYDGTSLCFAPDYECFVRPLTEAKRSLLYKPSSIRYHGWALNKVSIGQDCSIENVLVGEVSDHISDRSLGYTVRADALHLREL